MPLVDVQAQALCLYLEQGRLQSQAKPVSVLIKSPTERGVTYKVPAVKHTADIFVGRLQTIYKYTGLLPELAWQGGGGHLLCSCDGT